MKIDRRSFLVASSSALVLGKSKLSPAAFEQPPETPEPPEIERRIELEEVKKRARGEAKILRVDDVNG